MSSDLLYRCALSEKMLAESNSINAGLIFDRFSRILTLPPNSRRFEIRRDAKKRWLVDFINYCNKSRAYCNERLNQVHLRLDEIMNKFGGEKRVLITRDRFVLGLGNPNPADIGFSFENGTGLPVIPGSAVKGLARAGAAYLGLNRFESSIRTVFGMDTTGDLDSEPGSVIFMDALPRRLPDFEIDIINRHVDPESLYGKNALPMDSNPPNPVLFLSIKPGVPFVFRILPTDKPAFSNKSIPLKDVWKWLVNALENLGAGGKTAVGYGGFETT